MRNWDYRYTWIRDASLTLDALWIAACPDEAHHFFAWMAGAVATQIRRGVDLQIMFGVGGERDLTERTLDHLAGWRESRPVRIGNGAWSQRQLDVYGELLSAARRLREQLANWTPRRVAFWLTWPTPLPPAGKSRTRASGRCAASPATSCTPSSCAGSRSIAPSHWPTSSAPEDRVEDWTATRERDPREQSSPKAGATPLEPFTQAFGSDDFDAPALMMPIVGFLPAR